MKHLFPVVLISFSLLLNGCVENSQESSGAVEEKIGNSIGPGAGLQPEQKHQIEQYDIEEVAGVYNQQVEAISVALTPPHNDHKRGEHIRSLLKGLLEGPCLKNSDEILSRVIAILDKRINHLSGLLLKATDPLVIEKIKDRIESLEELEKKLIERKEDCANGVAECSDQIKQKLENLINKLDLLIADLEKKIDLIKDDKKKEHLEKMLNRAQSERTRLQDILSKC